MKIHDTLTRTKREFEPLEPGKVRMYVCGVTPYDFIHIGNARCAVFFDVVRRYLEYKGYDVNYVTNFTDIDDRIIARANDAGVTFSEYAGQYMKEFFTDSDGLNIKRATAYPLATEHIPEMISMISILVNDGYAYEKKGSVFFDTEKMENYGTLSHRCAQEQEAGARIKVDAEKKNPLDFVLWKPAKPGEPFWESPWGNGRPGWHIECSVMTLAHLGETIDIHAGGDDLLFPHHENELAQSEAANKKKFSNYWMHLGMVNVSNRKMSKSLGNFFTVRDLAETYGYDVLRFFLVSNHYRPPLNYTPEILDASANAFTRIKNCMSELSRRISEAPDGGLKPGEADEIMEFLAFEQSFISSMDDDFNTANAVTALFEMVKFINKRTAAGNDYSSEFYRQMKDKFEELCGILGLNPMESKKSFGGDTASIEELVARRDEARANRDWALADELRGELTKLGVELKDTPEGAKWAFVKRS